MAVSAFPAAQATAARARGAPVDPRKKFVEIPRDPMSENVYRLIPGEYNPPRKEKRYISQFATQTRNEYVAGVKPAASMGPAKVPLCPPKEYLKKRAAVLAKPTAKSAPRTRNVRKAAMALSAEPTKLAPPSKKDFVKQNALDNINSVAKNPKASPPLYLTKKDYGSNPVYNLKRQEHVRHQREEIEKNADQVALEQHAAELQEQGIVEMPEEERLKILAGLKQNWEKLNLGYQRLSLTVDTVPKITRKVTMEQQLKEYEELIARFSNTKIHVNFNPLFQ